MARTKPVCRVSTRERENATLEKSEVASSDPRRQVLRTQIEASNNEILQHNSALMEIERRTLQKLTEQAKSLPTPPRIRFYWNTRQQRPARYLPDKSALESVEK